MLDLGLRFHRDTQAAHTDPFASVTGHEASAGSTKFTITPGMTRSKKLLSDALLWIAKAAVPERITNVRAAD